MKKNIYVAECIEAGERFISLFLSTKTDKDDLMAIGHEMASGWGGECIKVRKYNAKKEGAVNTKDIYDADTGI